MHRVRILAKIASTRHDLLKCIYLVQFNNSDTTVIKIMLLEDCRCYQSFYFIFTLAIYRIKSR